MPRKIKRIGSLPQLPVEIHAGGASAGGGSGGGYDARDDYAVRLSRALYDWKLALEALIDDNNTGNGHIIQDEGVDLPNRARLNFIGSPVTATDDLANGRTNVTVTGGSTPPPPGEHLLTYGLIEAAQDTADMALGFASRNTIVQTTGSLWLFGNGADGSVHFDGVATFSFATLFGSMYVLLRSVFATDCIIDAGVIVTYFDYANAGVGGGQTIHCTGTFTDNGLCGGMGQRNLTNLKVGGLGTPSGVGTIYNTGTNGGNGGSAGGPVTGSAGSALALGWGGNGGAGGASSTPNAGGAGGVATPPADQDSGSVNMLSMPLIMQGGRVPSTTTPFWQRWAGGAGGGGGGAVTGTVDGGGGGGGGGNFLVCARLIAPAIGSLSCAGAVGNTGSGGSGNGGGGGGGGGGGILMIITTTPNPSANLTCTAAGGAGGAQVGGIGTAGSNGAAGRVISVIIT